MRQPLQSSPSAQRGVGALVVVMVLFFIMSMVAAYASRNLIFEQKTSANNYRAVQAFEAAEAGLEWAIAMLNGGRVDESCVGSADITKSSFRDRHLSIDVNDILDIRKWVSAGVDTDLLPTCVRDNAGWACSCPSNSGPVVAAPAGTGMAPSFQIKFWKVEDIAGRPVFRVRSQSCNSYGDRCFDPAGRKSDALAEVNAHVALAVSLAQAPTAALTVRGNLVANDARVSNSEGVVINTGGPSISPDPDANPNVKGPAGSPPRIEKGDRSLPTAAWMASAGGQSLGEMMFLANFGMDPATYRTQPAVVRISCVVGIECAVAVQAAADQFPGRVIWIDGDLNINAALTLGTLASPVILVVGGNMAFGDASNVTIFGMVYSRGASWANGAGTALVRGAFVAEGDAANDGLFTIAGAPSIVFEPQVVSYLKKVQARRALDFGSIVRVPGSWRDFQ